MKNKVMTKNIKVILLLITYTILLYVFATKIRTVFSVLGFILGVISPFLYGLGLAFILNIPLNFFEKRVFYDLEKSKIAFLRKCNRPFSIAVTYILLLLFISVLVSFVIPQLKASITTLIDNLPQYLRNLQNFADDISGHPAMTVKIWSQILSAWNSFIGGISSTLTNSLPHIFNITKSLTSFMFNFILAIVLSIYMLYSKEKLIVQIKKLMYAFLSKKVCAKILEVGNLTNKTFSGFISGQLTEAFIISALCFVGMSIFRLQFALLISVIIGVTSIIPIFGAIFGILPGAFILLMINPMQALWFVIFIIVLQQFENDVIYPKVMGNSIGLSGLWVLFSIVVGGSLFGFIGLLLGVPFFAVICAIIKVKVNERLEKKGIDVTKQQSCDDTPTTEQ